MASNIEKLTIKDTFTNWRDKINAMMDVAILAPMADEEGVMYIDVSHCNTREVRFNVPVCFESDVSAEAIRCTESFSSSLTATTVQETAEAGLTMTGNEGYIPWISGQTQNGTVTLWTSSYDDGLHFSYINADGTLGNTFSWDPETNAISASIGNAEVADVAHSAEALQVENKSGTRTPGSYPVFFGPVDGEDGSGAWDEALTYNPRDGILSAPTFKGDLDGNAKSATKASKLAEKRRITLGTDATGYVDFDGSQDVTLPCQLNATGVTGGLYGPAANVNVPRTNRRFTVPSFRVDEKGRITEAYTRTIEFPYPEVDVDNELDSSSRNPVSNQVVSQKIAEIEEIIAEVPTGENATTSSPGLMSPADKIKLNSLTQLPRINAVSIQNYDPETGQVSSSDTKSLSTAKTTQLTINGRNGLSGTLAQSSTSSSSVLTLNLTMNISSIAGSGLSVSNGKLTVPAYAGSGTTGLVPSASSAQRSLYLKGDGTWGEPVGTTYGAATTSANGLMSASDKTKLDGVQTGATKVAISRSLTSGTKLGTITINGTATDLYCEKNTNTTYSAFGAATASAAGTAGLVPAPPAGSQSKVITGGKSWIAVYTTSQTDTKLNAKANLASPAFTGTPTSPTPAAGDNTKKIATTAWVQTYCNTTKKYLTSHQSLASCVKTSGNQSISGNKTFSDTIKSNAGDVICGTGNACMVRIASGTTAQDGGHLVLWGSTHSQYPGVFNLTAQKGKNATARILSGKPDGTLEWKGNSVQVSSDERLKTAFGDVPDNVLDAWEKVQWGQYQFKDARKEKGADARLHLGLIAQRVKETFEKHGLDACRYGILCYEEDEGYDGLWMVRYQEAEAMENVCLRRRISRLEKRLEALEAGMKK